MRLMEFQQDNRESSGQFLEMFEKFLPLAMHHLELKSLPQMKFLPHIGDISQPTFGVYVNDEQTLYVALNNRHPIDILRTIAHELTHYKQDTEHELNDDSGSTGSPEENEANAMAGIVMRHFNKQYPEYLSTKPIVSEQFLENFADGRNPQDKGDSRRHGIPKKASLSTLDKIGRGSGRKAQLARWQANMRRGRNK
jgi:hypothetical protein